MLLTVILLGLFVCAGLLGAVGLLVFAEAAFAMGPRPHTAVGREATVLCEATTPQSALSPRDTRSAGMSL